jgi:hypothetical protein
MENAYLVCGDSTLSEYQACTQHRGTSGNNIRIQKPFLLYGVRHQSPLRRAELASVD